MPDNDDAALAPLIAAAPAIAGLTIDAGNCDGVLAHLKASLAIAGKIGAVGADAAPTFKP